MHNAPSVTYPVGRSLFAGGLLLCIVLLGAGVSAAWSGTIQVPGWRIPLQWATLASVSALAAWQWWRSPSGELNWDGASWHWQPGLDDMEVKVAVVLDLQRWMLLRCEETDAKHWLWVERSAFPGRWGDLRRAVYSRARAEPLPRRAAKP